MSNCMCENIYSFPGDTYKTTYSLSANLSIKLSRDNETMSVYEKQVVGAPSSFINNYVVCINVLFNEKRAVLLAVHSGRSCTADSSTYPKQKTHTSINMPQQGGDFVTGDSNDTEAASAGIKLSHNHTHKKKIRVGISAL